MATNVNDVRFRITAEDATAAAFSAVERKLSSLARLILPAFSIAAVIAFVRQAINAADAMNDLHLKTGLAYKDLGTFKLLAEQSGSSIEGVANAVKFLSKNMVENADGLKSIGVNAKDVNGALRQFADVISQIQDPALRTALAVEVLGKAGMDMIPVLIGGADAIEKAEERTRRYAEELEKAAPMADLFNDTMAELKLEASLVGMVMANEILPVLQVLADEMNNAAKESEGMAAQSAVLGDAFKGLAYITVGLAFGIKDIGRQIGAAAAMAAAAAKGEFSLVRNIWKEAAADAEKAAKDLASLQERILNAKRPEVREKESTQNRDLEERARLLIVNKDAAKQAADAAKKLRDDQLKAAEAVKAMFDPLFVLNKELESYNEMLERGDISLEVWGEAVVAAHAKAEKAIEAMGNAAGKFDPFQFNVEQAAAYLSIMESVHASVVSSAQGMASAFGDVGTAIGGMTMALSEFGLTQARIAAEAAAAIQKNPEKRAEIEIAAANKAAQAQIKSYGDIAAASKGFFKEHSKGYKAMETAEKTFRAIELAMSVKALAQRALEALGILKVSAANVSSVPAYVAAEEAKAVAAGTTAAAAQGSIPIAGFALMAAMIAALIAIGVKMKGGGKTADPTASLQESAGTGSVFGDPTAKSQSISNSIKILEENSFKDLEFSNDMLNALRAIVSNTEGLVNLIQRRLNLPGGPGDITGLGLGTTSNSPFGSDVVRPFSLENILSHGDKYLMQRIFGTVTKKLIDFGLLFEAQTLANIEAQGLLGYAYETIATKTKKLFGLIKSTKVSDILTPLDDEITRQFTLIILNIRDAVYAAGDVLGLSGQELLKDFVVDLGKISLEGLSGQEIQEQFDAIFSKLGDDMAKTLLPEIEQFAKIGEGALETLVRIARNYQTVDLVLKSIGQTFSQVGVGSIEARERLIDLSGGIEDFIKQAQEFAETFLTEAERAAPVLNSVLAELDRLGIHGVYTMDAFKNLVLSLDLTTEEGAALYAALMKLAPAFATAVNAVNSAVRSYFSIILEAQQFQFDLQQRIAGLSGGGGGAAALVAMGITLIEQYKSVTTTLEEKRDILGQLAGLVDQWVKQRMADLAREKQAITDAANERIAALQKELAIARQWASVLSDAQQLLDQMRLTTANPLPTSGRLHLASLEVARLKQQLAAAAPEERAEISRKLLDALQKQLGLAQEFYQRPSPEYQAIYNSIIKQISEIEAEAKEQADEALRIQREISALQEATVAQLKAIDARVAEINEQAISWYNQIAAEAAIVYELLRQQAEQEILKLADAANQRDVIIQILADINAKLGVPAPGFAHGLAHVPFDNFPARLHKGERVLTAKESANYGASNITISVPVTVNGNADGKAVADAVDKRINEMIPVIKQKLKRA